MPLVERVTEPVPDVDRHSEAVVDCVDVVVIDAIAEGVFEDDTDGVNEEVTLLLSVPVPETVLLTEREKVPDADGQDDTELDCMELAVAENTNVELYNVDGDGDAELLFVMAGESDTEIVGDKLLITVSVTDTETVEEMLATIDCDPDDVSDPPIEVGVNIVDALGDALSVPEILAVPLEVIVKEPVPELDKHKEAVGDCVGPIDIDEHAVTEVVCVEPTEAVTNSGDELTVADDTREKVGETEDDNVTVLQLLVVSEPDTETVVVELKDTVGDPDADSDERKEGVSLVDALEVTQTVGEMLLETLTEFDTVPVFDDERHRETELDEVELTEAVACCNDGLLEVDGDGEIEDVTQALSVDVIDTVAVELKDTVGDPDADSDERKEGVSLVDALEVTQTVGEMLLETLTEFDTVPVFDDERHRETELDEVELTEAVACCNDGLLEVDGDDDIEDVTQALSVDVTETVVDEERLIVPDVEGDGENIEDADGIDDAEPNEVELNVTVSDTVVLVDRVYVFDADGHEVTEID